MNKYKEILSAEEARLTAELESIAKRDPANPLGWTAVETDLDSDSADENEVADEIEDYEENQAIVNKLAPELAQTEKALARLAAGTYGRCEVCDAEIPAERLEINPAATTCMTHAK